MDPREADLVRRFREGDEKAAEILVRKYTKTTLGLIYSQIGRVQETEDLVQDVFLEAQRSVTRLRNPDRFSSWLYKITRRVCNRWLRENRKAPAHLEEPEELQEPRQDHGKQESEAEVVRRAVDGMPEPLREVLYLRYYQNLSYERMGALLGITPSAVNARLTKARKLFKTKMRALSREDV